MLVFEVRELQKKYAASGNGLIKDKLRKKEIILDNVIKQEMKPRDPQQVLFESK